MATTYYYRLFDVDFGPVGFNQLVELVRDESLSTDDLVRADWEQEWHPAAEVVGLFHIAGRNDLLEAWMAEQARLRQIEETPVESHEAEVSDAELPAWQRRLLEVQGRESQRQNSEDVLDEVSLARLRGEIDSTMAEADAANESRAATPRKSWINELGSMFSLRSILRTGLAVLFANLTAWYLLHWTTLEAQRFPPRDGRIVLYRSFPVWGECSTGEYAFLFFDTVILAAGAGVLSARVLELVAHD